MNCKNCETTLLETHNYCPSCGAKVIRNRLTIKNLFSSFAEQFFSYDNKLLKTFKHLFTKPEVVIGSYIDGTRKKYINATQYFAITLMISGIQLFILNKFFPELMDLSALSVQGSEEFNNRNFKFIEEYQTLIMMFYVPIYALMSKLVFIDYKKYNYTEHMVIFMYIISQATLVGFILTLISSFFGTTIGMIALFFSVPFQIIYSAYCLKRLFGLSLGKIILRTILFLIVLTLITIIFSILYVAGLYVVLGKEGMLEVLQSQGGLPKN